MEFFYPLSAYRFIVAPWRHCLPCRYQKPPVCVRVRALCVFSRWHTKRPGCTRGLSFPISRPASDSGLSIYRNILSASKDSALGGQEAGTAESPQTHTGAERAVPAPPAASQNGVCPPPDASPFLLKQENAYCQIQAVPISSDLTWRMFLQVTKFHSAGRLLSFFIEELIYIHSTLRKYFVI